MDRQIVGKVLVGLVLAGVSADVSHAAGWAEALFSEQGHDFGPVPRGAKVRHRFVLTNRLAEPLTLVNLRASCGCTSGKASASLIAPGQSAFVEAEMDTRNFAGHKATTLFVTLVTASGKEAEVRLAVSSEILADIVLNPGTIDFGNVARGQTPKAALTIDRRDAPGWKAERMVSASRVIDASLVETARAGGVVQYTLTATLKPDAPAGVVRDEIRILTNDRESPSIPVLVTGQIRGDLTVSPAVVAMGRSTSAGGSQARVMVRASKPFAIVGVEGAGDGFTVGATDAARKALHVLTIAYRPEAGTTRGGLRRTFRIRTDLPGEPPAEVTATIHVDP